MLTGGKQGSRPRRKWCTQGRSTCPKRCRSRYFECGLAIISSFFGKLKTECKVAKKQGYLPLQQGSAPNVTQGPLHSSGPQYLFVLVSERRRGNEVDQGCTTEVRKIGLENVRWPGTWHSRTTDRELHSQCCSLGSNHNLQEPQTSQRAFGRDESKVESPVEVASEGTYREA